jgi:hypothetical protein
VIHFFLFILNLQSALFVQPVNETTLEITLEADPMVTLLALFTGPGGPWTIAYLGVFEDSRDGCGKTVVRQLGWDGMKG